ncbi:MAG: hypothetical protein P1P88_01420 [Bacteroidales bacterium]|nr:hypothetical protein [Bacteroidales bacterium]
MMKALLSLIVVLFISVAANTNSFYEENNAPSKFTGTYNGLTEDMEFEFTDVNGKTYLFQEVGEDVAYDLYEEENFGQKFNVTWEERMVEETDDEGEPTGNTFKVKVIIDLEKL